VERPNWAPEDIDVERPSAARVYDFFLGGSHNFAADRAVAHRILEAVPDAAAAAFENRAFLGRAVRFMLDRGVRQFIDLGSGIPTRGNVHEVAHRVDPQSRVVYVDLDPVAVAHSRAMLADVAPAAVVAADLRRPVEVLADPELLRVIDLNQPVGILLISVLHFIPDDQYPANIVAGYVAPAAPGSYLALSHVTVETLVDNEAEAISLYNKAVDEVHPRTREEVAALFGDLTMVEPGLEYVANWRPDPAGERPPDARHVPLLCGVGRKD
jgi:O-methyltransferase involved in polyketide biosynthesis